jgi:hypothetical protein
MSNSFVEYMKMHRISLIQDMDKLHSSDEEYKYIEGQVLLTEHYLSVANDMISKW